MSYTVSYPKKLDKFLGSLLGVAVGDALGMPYEGLPPKLVRRYIGDRLVMRDGRLKKGSYTDDTEMMIGVLESLVKNRGFSKEDMAKRFIENFNRKRGYGRGTIHVLSLIKKGVSIEKAVFSMFSEGSFGNGAAMRIAPVGLLYHKRPDLLREISYGVSSITHGHVIAKEAACVVSYAISLCIICEEKKEFLKKIIEFAQVPEVKRKLEDIEKIGERDPEFVAKALGNSVKADEAVASAIYSFLYSDTFYDALHFSVSIGGDTDTISAICGGIAGAFWGKEAIPKDWLCELEDGKKGKSYIESLAKELFRLSNEI